MHIVIDARNIGSSTGIYTQRLLHHLQSLDKTNHYTVLVLKKYIDVWVPINDNFIIVEADYPNYSFHEQIGFAWLLYKLKPDLVHFCMPQQPLLFRGKSVTTIHDLTLVRFDNIDGNAIVYKTKKQIFKWLLRIVIHRSLRIISPTEYTKQDIMRFAGRKYQSKIRVTLLAGEPVDAKPEAIDELKGKQFIFFVGNAFPYKNLRRIVDAYSSLKVHHSKLQLVFAGKFDYFYEQLREYTLSNGIKDVHFLGFISEGQKRWAFQNTEAYVVASLSEGFHIPLLEAMYEHCPVISSDVTCLPEVAGDAALYFDPHSTSDLSATIEKVLKNSKLRAQLTVRGNKQVKKYSWEKTANETLAVYTEVL
ncbi:MAG: glycosyltransferase family 4 protein [Candidatus Saccharimonadales bacterium]